MRPIPLTILLSALGLGATVATLAATWGAAIDPPVDILSYWLIALFVIAFPVVYLAIGSHPARHPDGDGESVSLVTVARSTPLWATFLSLAAIAACVTAGIRLQGALEFFLTSDGIERRPDRVLLILTTCAAMYATALAIGLSARALGGKAEWPWSPDTLLR